MRIAFFNYLPLEYGGGTAKYYSDTSCALKKYYPELYISIATFDKKYSDLLMSLYSLYFFRNIKKDYSRKGRSGINNLKTLKIKYIKVKSIKSLKVFLKKQDIIYCKNDILETFILKFLIGYNNLNKVIIGIHTPVKYDNTNLFHSKIHNILYDSSFYRLLIRNATKLHVLNNFDLHKLKRMFPSKAIVKIPNPFDFDKFSSYANIYKYKLDIPSEKFKIVWVGRINREKGADDLLKIIKSVNSDYKNKVSWIIAGVGEYRNRILSLAKIHNNINLLGYINNEYLPSIYKKCDLFLSTSKFETFPYTFLEAQSLGVPVISYNIHGCNEIIRNNKNGFIVSSYTDMSKKIRFLIKNNIFDRKEIKNSIRREFNINNIYNDLYTLLTSF